MGPAPRGTRAVAKPRRPKTGEPPKGAKTRARHEGDGGGRKRDAAPSRAPRPPAARRQQPTTKGCRGARTRLQQQHIPPRQAAPTTVAPITAQRTTVPSKHAPAPHADFSQTL
eukprot:2778298-Lingulodinium_polyedra.AAC.1